MLKFTLKTLKIYRKKLSRQQMKTLVGQAKSGDCLAALRGLNRLLDEVKL